MQRIITNNGGEISIVSIGSMSDMLYINTIAYNFVELAGIFSDASAVSHIDYYNGETYVRSYEGYTVLSDIALMDDGVMMVMLKKPQE